MAATKISIAIDDRRLRLARAAAKSEKLSLSAFISRAVDLQIEEHDRLEAARKLWAAWGPESEPSEADRAALRRHMRRKRRAA
jgi:hypothetical protein